MSDGRSTYDREELVYETEQKLLSEDKKDCPHCRGDGFEIQRPMWKCKECNGTGRFVDTIKSRIHKSLEQSMDRFLYTPNTPRTKTHVKDLLNAKLRRHQEAGDIDKFEVFENPEKETIEVRVHQRAPMAMEYLSIRLGYTAADVTRESGWTIKK